MPPGAYARLRSAAAALSPRNRSLAAERTRGAVMSHRDWLAADGARTELQQRWRELFREWDVVLCPAMPTPAFPHDHSSPIESRRIEIDGRSYAYLDAQIVWAELATTPGLPATVAPIDRSESGLPIGVQIIGPYLEDRTTIALCRTPRAGVRRFRASARLVRKTLARPQRRHPRASFPTGASRRGERLQMVSITPRTALTFCANCSIENGFGRKFTPRSSTPL